VKVPSAQWCSDILARCVPDFSPWFGVRASSSGCCPAATGQVDGTVAEGFEGVGALFPPGLFDNGRPGRGEMALGWEQLSGKMGFVAQLLAVLRQTTDDK
jgi:hypothetical protein